MRLLLPRTGKLILATIVLVFALIVSACQSSIEPIVDERTLFFDFSGSSGTSYDFRCTDPTYLANRADYILDGTVQHIDSGSGLVTTRIAVDNWLKGTLDIDRLELKQNAGSVSVDGGPPTFGVRHTRRFRIFLQDVPGSDKVIFVCGEYGAIPLQSPARISDANAEKYNVP